MVDAARRVQLQALARTAVFLRKNVFERVGYLDETLDFGMDYELWPRLRRLKVGMSRTSWPPFAGTRRRNGDQFARDLGRAAAHCPSPRRRLDALAGVALRPSPPHHGPPATRADYENWR
ncbi:MAG: hypothetical protein ACR2IK_15715 [Chloroflexota bacterium]